MHLLLGSSDFLFKVALVRSSRLLDVFQCWLCTSFPSPPVCEDTARHQGALIALTLAMQIAPPPSAQHTVH